MHKSSIFLATLCCLSLSAFAESPDAPHPHALHHSMPDGAHPHALHHPKLDAHETPAPGPEAAQQPPIHIISNQPPSTPPNAEDSAIKAPQPASPTPDAASTPPQTADEEKTASTPEASKTTTPSWAKALKELFN